MVFIILCVDPAEGEADYFFLPSVLCLWWIHCGSSNTQTRWYSVRRHVQCSNKAYKSPRVVSFFDTPLLFPFAWLQLPHYLQFISLRNERTLMLFFFTTCRTSSTMHVTLPLLLHIELEIYLAITIRNLIITPNMVIQRCIFTTMTYPFLDGFCLFPYHTKPLLYFSYVYSHWN
jgi:hypothetical protein